MEHIKRSLLRLVMLNKGIVPMDGSPFDANRSLENVPTDEARAMKRKFRKLWRRAMKEASSNPFRAVNLATSNGSAPSRLQRQNRKVAVLNKLLKEVPALIEGRTTDEQVKKPI